MEMQAPLVGRFSAKDLSRVDPFRLGPLTVEPATRSLSAEGRRETVEPRVMQVLVALGLDPGQVLSRDDLIALCWDGRIVGDNAINRVISLLRHALADVAGQSVRLETITKVGFRLVVSEAEPPARRPVPDSSARHRAPLGRRRLLAGGAVLAAAAMAGGFTAWRYRGHTPDPKALQLVRHADLLMKSGLPGTTRQATSELEQAVRIDPDYADAWGALAGMYRHSFMGFSDGERQSYPRMVRSAADRALALDPAQPDALLALALMRPFLGRWSEAERDLRAIWGSHPDHWYASAQLNLLLMDVGRMEDALEFRMRSLAVDDAIAGSRSFLALNQLLAGRLHEADATLDSAAQNWPNHAMLWFMRYRVLLESGRPAGAAAFVRDSRFLPDKFPPEAGEEAAMIADAIASTDRGVRQRAVDYILKVMDVPEMVEDGAPALALLGEGELALAACSAAFLGGTFAGRTWPKPGEYDMRSTALLFYPSILGYRALPQYATILDRVGLEAYWKRSGSQPDFRRD